MSELNELILLTTEQLGLQEPYVVEKDWHITKAIEALMQVRDENFQLVFHGGTALAKAHKLIRRMSEDCDFRILYKNSKKLENNKSQRGLLREYRQRLTDVLKDIGFITESDAVSVKNEGRFISIRMRYASEYATPKSLKPFLAFEFNLATLKMPTTDCQITTLMQETFGEKLQHPIVQVSTMSIVETAAEKWVALTRRITTKMEDDAYHTQALVRHLYDLYEMREHVDLQDNTFSQLATQIIEEDRQRYKSQHDGYYNAPRDVITASIHELTNNPVWEQHWSDFIVTMVYGDAPSYKVALSGLRAYTDAVLN